MLKKTPIEKYSGIDVKREDLCAPDGWPPFSKIRGLLPQLKALKEQGIRNFGYVDTQVSMAGWGVAAVAKEIGCGATIFTVPFLKDENAPNIATHKKLIESVKTHGGEVIVENHYPLRVRWNIANRAMSNRPGKKSLLLPIGLPLDATVDETFRIAKPLVGKYASIVVCVGSGTIASGILRAVQTQKSQTAIYGVGVRAIDPQKTTSSIVERAFPEGVLWMDAEARQRHDEAIRAIHVVSMPRYKYLDPAVKHTPFPCNQFYDAKAWEWLLENEGELKAPILFWNVGGPVI